MRRTALCVCSGGGHLTEMLCLMEALSGYNCVLVTYSGPNNESKNKLFSSQYTISHVFSGLSSFVMFFITLARIVIRERPAVVFSTGGEISLPVMYLGKLLYRSKNIFVESAAQVKKPSRTGRLIYPAADLFLVQWPALKAVYGRKAEYAGCLI